MSHVDMLSAQVARIERWVYEHKPSAIGADPVTTVLSAIDEAWRENGRVRRQRNDQAGELNAARHAAGLHLNGREDLAEEIAHLRATLDAVIALHRPEPGWEREWKDPAKALEEGLPICAGCVHPGGTAFRLKDCPTRAAMRGAKVAPVLLEEIQALARWAVAPRDGRPPHTTPPDLT